MLRALIIVLAACGGAAKPAVDSSLENTAGSTSGSAAPLAGGSARVIARDAGGGEIEMTAETGPAFDQAKEHMSRHCGDDGYLLVEMERRDTGRQVLVDGEQAPERVYRLRYACVPRKCPHCAP